MALLHGTPSVIRADDARFTGARRQPASTLKTGFRQRPPCSGVLTFVKSPAQL